MNLEVDRTQPPDAARVAGDQPRAREAAAPAARARLDPRRLDRLADHRSREPRLVGLGGRRRRNDAARAHDGDRVGGAHDFVELVADEQDRAALALQRRINAISSVTCAGASTAVGSSRIRTSTPR